MINVNHFSQIDYSISTGLGFWSKDSVLISVADRLFLQYSFFIHSNESSFILSPYYFLRYYCFIDCFKRCFDFILFNNFWYNNYNNFFYERFVLIYNQLLLNVYKFNFIEKINIY